MESAASSTVDTEHHTAEHPAHDAAHDPAHGDAFYEQTNPKYFGLPLGVLIAAAVAAVSVCITLVKFFGLRFFGH